MPTEKQIARAKRNESIVADWFAGWRYRDIAERCECSEAVVSNVVCRARDAGDERLSIPERELEMKRAELFKSAIIAEWRAGKSIEEIAKSLGIQAREVRAAVYLAVKANEAGGVFSNN